MLNIDSFIKAIEEGLYIQAHEILEEDWKAYKKAGLKKEAKALQGLINGATALALLVIKHRVESYKKVWPVFLKYKILLDEIKIDNIEKFLEAKDLLEDKNIKHLKNLKLY